MLPRIASWCTRRRRTVVAAWLLAVIAVSVLSSQLGGELRADYKVPGSQSAAASDLLAERFPQQAGDVVYLVYRADAGLSAPATQSRIFAVEADLAKLPHVSGLQPGGVAADGKTAITELHLDGPIEAVPVAAVTDIMDRALEAKADGFTVEAGGWAVQNAEANSGSSEGIGILVALLILVVAFGSVIAAGLPLAIAIPGLGVSLGLAALVANAIQVPEWGVTLASMIGLGVGIDYALLIITRYRSVLAEGVDPEAAVVTALTTAGRSALFAGGTVVISVMGLGAIGLEYLWGAAIAISLSVLLVLAASLTLLPAALGFAGRNIDRFRLPFIKGESNNGLWRRWSHVVQRRPLVTGGIALVALLAMAAPVLGLRLGEPDAGTGNVELTSRRAYDLVTEGFGPGANGPFVVAVDFDGAKTGTDTVLAKLTSAMAADPGVAAVTPARLNPAGDAAVLTVVPKTSPQDEATGALLNRLEDEVVPPSIAGSGATVTVGGATAAAADTTSFMGSRIPVFIAAVVALSFLLLLAVFRAPLVALKAAVMNLLAIGAAYGVMALAVQGGWLGNLIGISEPTVVPVYVPILMFAMLFGLSMDYEVFLLSRIKEEHDRTGDNATAVAEGIARTGRVITAAAAIMVTVFLAFVLEDAVLLKIVGIGLSTAVFVDATLVRMVLVPSTMELLGERNWWLPGWLDRVLPRFDLEGHVQRPGPRAGRPGGRRAGARSGLIQIAVSNSIPPR